MDYRSAPLPRRDYPGGPLNREDLHDSPLVQFGRWFDAARDAGEDMPEKMVVATVSADGQPSARTVLLKGVRDGQFVFYTDYGSTKAQEIAANPRVALHFLFSEQARQVCIRGTAERTSEEESEEYFRSRPRESQISAFVSEQSSVIPSREWLEARYREAEEEFAGREVPRKEGWGGYAVTPSEVVFWQGRGFRLHDRFRYRRADEGGWIIERLSP